MSCLGKALGSSIVVLSLLTAEPGQSAEVTRVVSGSGESGDSIDFHLSLAWQHEARTASLKREMAVAGGVASRVDDLVYRQTRDVLTFRGDIGVYKDLSLFVTLPVVLADDRRLDFDRGAGCPILAAGEGCVNETTSSLLRDRIVSRPNAMGQFGWDTEHNRPFERGSESVFRGPTRRGVESLGVGASWAVFNQARDDTKPTWIMRFESRFAVSKAMRFDAAQPRANRSVGLGYTQVLLSTLASRRFGFLEPYVGFAYMLPVGMGGVYDNPALGENAFSRPQQRVAAEAGLDITAWQDARAKQRVSFELRGRYELRIFGLAQGELWEPLSGSSACPADAAACRRDVDRDLDGDGMTDPNPGVTRSPSYGVFGGDLGISMQVGRYVRFRGLVGMILEQDRFLTDGRTGNEVYDIPGRRFFVDGGRSWNLLVDGGLLF